MSPEDMDELFQLIQVNPKPMSIEDLIEASKKLSISPESVAAFEERIREREAQYKEEHPPITNEFLNREYTI